jgi:RNA polymerase sigma-70 factor (ECF subfamily)
MDSTPVSLLERLRQPAADKDWERFVELYTPLLHHWGRRCGLKGQDLDDLVQDVLTTLVQKLPEFSYDQTKSFRGWLWTVTLNTWKNSRRRPSLPFVPADSGLSDATVPDPAAAVEEAEYRSYLVGRALELMQDRFPPTTWQACRALLVEGKSAAEVAEQFGLGVPTVYVYKSQVLAQLRLELAGLLD